MDLFASGLVPCTVYVEPRYRLRRPGTLYCLHGDSIFYCRRAAGASCSVYVQQLYPVAFTCGLAPCTVYVEPSIRYRLGAAVLNKKPPVRSVTGIPGPRCGAHNECAKAAKQAKQPKKLNAKQTRQSRKGSKASKSATQKETKPGQSSNGSKASKVVNK